MFLCSLCIPHIITKEAESKIELIHPYPIMNLIGQALSFFAPNITFAEGYKAEPSNITIGINEQVTIRVGNFNLMSGEFEPVQDWFFFADRFLTFSAEFPDGNPGGSWFVNFNPPTVSQKSTEFLITNATISLSSPPGTDKPIQSTNITIIVADTWVVKNIWWPEDHSLWKMNGGKFSVILWMGGAFFGKYGKMSGTMFTEYYRVDILVKVKPFHKVKIEALPPSKLAPNEITSIPILVENQGNYNDTFNFRIRTETGYPLILTNNGTITLQPGEQDQALVGMAVPANILDTGTLHSLIIDIYSSEQPNTSIATQRIFLETQGFYLSEENIVYAVGFGLIILVVLFLSIYWRRKVSGTIFLKPERPWKIPEEQQYLQELKRTDKKAYEQERIMMKDEYKSALLWYEGYTKSSQKKLRETKPMKYLSTYVNKAKTSLKGEKKPEKKPTKPFSAIFNKSEKTTKTEQKKKQPSIPSDDIALEKALAKIRKEQEKQLQKTNI